MEITKPVNIDILDVDKFIKEHFVQEVTSLLMYEPSTTSFHPYGLYSESIFGQIGTTDRISKVGYIDFHTDIIHPLIYKDLIAIAGYYDDILHGTVYALWNEKEKRFDLVDKDTPNARTGYSFFIEYFKYCKFTSNSSILRNTKIKVIERAIASNTHLLNKYLICPAGWRDVKIGDSGNIETEDVNKLYSSLIAISGELNNLNVSSSMLTVFLDNMRYNIQLKSYEIYKHWKNILGGGKSSFGQEHYTKRAIASGTRNVITASTLEATDPSDPSFIKANDTFVPLFQLAKAFEDIVCYTLNTFFYAPIFTMGSINVPAIDPKTYKVKYVEVAATDITAALSVNEKAKLISRFKDVNNRHKAVTIRSTDGKDYYLWMVYDLGNKIYTFRDINDLSSMLGLRDGNVSDDKLSLDDVKETIDLSKVRPLTYIEMLYIAVHSATSDKYGTITRYPAIVVGSIYPTSPIATTTVPDRIVTYSSQYSRGDDRILPHYPILDSKQYQDSLIIHPSKTVGLNADYDGDTVSFNSIMSIEANNECKDYLNEAKSKVSITLRLYDTCDTKTCVTVFHALTRLPPDVTLPIAE